MFNKKLKQCLKQIIVVSENLNHAIRMEYEVEIKNHSEHLEKLLKVLELLK